MQTAQLQISLPTGLSEDEARLLLAIKLYETSKVSLGQAAEMAGYSRRTFLELLDHHEIPVVAYSPEELREELGL